jgi:membrane fusion protein (multidrug efflux system)
MVVGADGKVTPVPVKTGSAQGDVWIVTEGLKGGEKVIVEGLQKAQPGAVVKAVPFVAHAPAATGGASAPAGGASAAAAPGAKAPASAPAAPASQPAAKTQG